MKVKGRPDEVTPDAYAREVAVLLVETLEQRDDSMILPAPGEMVQVVEHLVIYSPDESPNELAELLSPYWTGARVREALNLGTRQALDSRRRNGSILGLKSTDGDVLYPVRQFQRRPDGQVEVKPALVPLLRALRAFDSWTVGVLLCTPAPELSGLTPFDWVRQDRPAEALEDLGRAVAREWSAGAA